VVAAVGDEPVIVPLIYGHADWSAD
jgi:hypothetical protein